MATEMELSTLPVPRMGAACFTFTFTMIVMMMCDCFRSQKDIALLSLSNILHQVHYSNEAAVVIHAALDMPRDMTIYSQIISYFMLGNIYAVGNAQARWREGLLYFY